MAENTNEEQKKTEQKRTTQRSTQQEPEKKAVERVVYVGPTLANGLTETTVFKGGIPNVYRRLFETTPELEQLFVPAEDFAKTKNDAETPGTAIYAAREVVASKKGVL